MAKKLIKRINNREFYAKFADYAAMDENGERLSDRKVKSVSVSGGTMTVTNTDGEQEVPVVPVPDTAGLVLKSGAEGSYEWGAAGAEPGNGRLLVQLGDAQSVDSGFNANSARDVTLSIPVSTEEDAGLMSALDKAEFDRISTGFDNKAEQADVNALEGRVAAVENSVATKADQTDLDALGNAVTGLTGRIETVETDVGTLSSTKADQTDLDALDNVVTGLTGRVGTIETDVGTLSNTKADQSDLDALGNTVTGLTGRVEGIENDVADLSNNKANQSDLDNVVATVESLDGRADALETVTDSLSRNKADMVNNATAGDIATLDASGNLADSGIPGTDAADAVEKKHSHVNKAILDNVTAAYTSEEATKLEGIKAGAEVNIIETVKAGETALLVENKTVTLPVDSDRDAGLVSGNAYRRIPAAPTAGADRVYSFDDTNGVSWQAIVKAFVGELVLDQTGNEITDENHDGIVDNGAVQLWLSYKNTEFGARRAYEDHTGQNIHAALATKANMAQVNTAIETALANYGGFAVVPLNTDPPIPDVPSPSAKIIYLTKEDGSTKTDPYTEWIYTADSHWEVIGETSIDLSGKQDSLSALPTMAANMYLQTDANQNIVWGNPPATEREIAVYTYGQTASSLYTDYRAGKLIYCKYSGKLAPLMTMGSSTCDFLGVFSQDNTVSYSGPRFVYITLSGNSSWGVREFKIPETSTSDWHKVLTVESNGTLTWQLPAQMGGASASTAGTAGTVPAPAAGDQVKFLKGDGTWDTVADSPVSMVTYNSTAGTTINAAIRAGKAVICDANNLQDVSKAKFGLLGKYDLNNDKYQFLYIYKDTNAYAQQLGDIAFRMAFCNGSSNSWYGQIAQLTFKAPTAAGQVMKSASNGAGEFDWTLSIVREVPASSTSDSGKMLGVDSEGNSGWLTFENLGLMKARTNSVAGPRVTYLDINISPAAGVFSYQTNDGVQRNYYGVPYQTSTTTNGQVLMYDSNNGPYWGTAPGLPASAVGDAGKVLTVNSSGAAEWLMPSSMTGATASAAGTSGVVPAPGAGDEGKFLKGDGTWDSPPAVSLDGYYYDISGNGLSAKRTGTISGGWQYEATLIGTNGNLSSSSLLADFTLSWGGQIQQIISVNTNNPNASYWAFGYGDKGARYMLPPPSTGSTKYAVNKPDGKIYWDTIPSYAADPTVDNSILLGQHDGSKSWVALGKDVVGTLILDVENGEPVLDVETGAPVYDVGSATNLWTSLNGDEFAARRSYEDQDGNNIKSTYATKTELTTALGNIEALLAAI